MALFLSAGAGRTELTERDIEQIHSWWLEVCGRCEPRREEQLVCCICAALSGFMGMEPDLVRHAILYSGGTGEMPCAISW